MLPKYWRTNNIWRIWTWSFYFNDKNINKEAYDDLNTAKSLAVLFDLATRANKNEKDAYTKLYKLGSVLGFKFEKEGLSDEDNQKAIKAVADSFRANPNFNSYETILELGTGEALISVQNEKGEPTIVERATVLPPQSKIGVIDDLSRNKIINSCELLSKYFEDQDDDSAFEKINNINEIKRQEEEKKEQERLELLKQKEEEKKKKEEEKAKKNTIGYKLGKKVANQTTNTIIRKGVNSVLKNLFK